MQQDCIAPGCVMVKLFGVPVGLLRQGLVRAVLACAGYDDAVVEEFGGELARFPGICNGEVVLAVVRSPSQDADLAHLPTSFTVSGVTVRVAVTRDYWASPGSHAAHLRPRVQRRSTAAAAPGAVPQPQTAPAPPAPPSEPPAPPAGSQQTPPAASPSTRNERRRRSRTAAARAARACEAGQDRPPPPPPQQPQPSPVPRQPQPPPAPPRQQPPPPPPRPQPQPPSPPPLRRASSAAAPGPQPMQVDEPRLQPSPLAQRPPLVEAALAWLEDTLAEPLPLDDREAAVSCMLSQHPDMCERHSGAGVGHMPAVLLSALRRCTTALVGDRAVWPPEYGDGWQPAKRRPARSLSRGRVRGSAHQRRVGPASPRPHRVQPHRTARSAGPSGLCRFSSTQPPPPPARGPRGGAPK